MKAQHPQFEEIIKARFAVLIGNLAKQTKDNERQFEHFANVERFLVREIAIAKAENTLKTLNNQ